MSSNIGDEKSNIREECPTIDLEDSLSLKICSSISLESITFLCIIKKGKQFWVDPECEAAFQEFMTYLSSPPILCKHEISYPLHLYFSVSDEAIAGTLVQEDMKQQFPMYFITKTL